ncbi:MAG: (5-formylfuran-3-yl)methyl phosphate synthase [Planctomycetaceae bacterium]
MIEPEPRLEDQIPAGLPVGELVEAFPLNTQDDRDRFLQPRLLVSVRNAVEGVAAMRGGCDILDLKEPERGSLGAVEATVASEVLEAIRLRVTDAVAPLSILPVSIALGEVRDAMVIRGKPLDLPPLVTQIRQFFAGVSYLKLGSAGLRDVPNWQSHWHAVEQQYLDGFHSKALHQPQWVAVAYADASLAAAPTMSEVFEAAVERGCRGFLVDTWGKSDKRLFDWTSLDELRDLFTRAKAAGLLTAVAGRLRPVDFPLLTTLPVDIVGVRTAACTGGDRLGAIDPGKIVSLQEALQEAFAGMS